MRRGLVAERLDESSPARSAGNDAKRNVRPGRDDRNIWLLISLMPLTRVSSPRSSHPGRSLFKTLTQHFVLGYFHWVPPGRLLPAHISSPYVDADGRQPDLYCRWLSNNANLVARRDFDFQFSTIQVDFSAEIYRLAIEAVEPALISDCL